MASLSDSFNRADSNTLGANWTDRNGLMGIESNMAYPRDASALYCTSTFNTSLDTNDMEVTLTLGTVSTGNAVGAWVVLGANTSGECVLVFYASAISDLSIYSMTGWGNPFGGTQRSTVSATFNSGDTLGLRRIGNGYTAIQNGVAVSGSAWTDSGDVIPRDSGHLIAGFGSHTNGTNYRRVDAWAAADVTSPAKPRSLFVRQAFKRASFY